MWGTATYKVYAQIREKIEVNKKKKSFNDLKTLCVNEDIAIDIVAVLKKDSWMQGAPNSLNTKRLL